MTSSRWRGEAASRAAAVAADGGIDGSGVWPVGVAATRPTNTSAAIVRIEPQGGECRGLSICHWPASATRTLCYGGRHRIGAGLGALAGETWGLRYIFVLVTIYRVLYLNLLS